MRNVKISPKQIILAALIVLSFLVPFGLDDYVLTVLAMAVTYAIMATGYNVLLGYTGMFSFGHMAFAGLSGYICCILMNQGIGWPFLLSMLVSVLAVSALAFLTAYPALGLKGHFFGIGTLAIGESIVLVLTNLSGITGGTQGLLLNATPKIFSWNLVESKDYYYVALIFFLIATGAIWFIVHKTHLGQMWIAVRGDEEYAASLGINTKTVKLTSYVISCALSAVGGCIYLVILSCLTPEQFNSSGTTQILMMVLIGGKGTAAGPIIGALLLVWLPLLINMSPQLKLIVYGLILIVVILLVPNGIVGLFRRRSKRLKGGIKIAADK